VGAQQGFGLGLYPQGFPASRASAYDVGSSNRWIEVSGNVTDIAGRRRSTLLGSASSNRTKTLYVGSSSDSVELVNIVASYYCGDPKRAFVPAELASPEATASRSWIAASDLPHMRRSPNSETYSPPRPNIETA
jgi:hypothetical protein